MYYLQKTTKGGVFQKTIAAMKNLVFISKYFNTLTQSMTQFQMFLKILNI